MTLLEAEIQNFKSFRAPAAVSLVSSAKSKKVKKGKGAKTLPVALFLGANGSGKSNFFAALRFLIESVNEGKVSEAVPFLLDVESRRRPTVFRLRFGNSPESFFTYSAAILGREVREELLTRTESGDESVVFSRNGKKTEVTELSDKDARQVMRNLSASRLAVSDLLKSDDPALEPLKQFFTGFRFEDSEIPGTAAIELPQGFFHQKEIRDRMTKYLASLDPSITGLTLKRGSGAANSRLSVSHSVPGGLTFTLPLEAESAGSQKMLALYSKLFPVLKEGGVAVIDGLSASLHPSLVQDVISLFEAPETNPHGAQLLCSSHDAVTLRDKSLPSDAVWLVNKELDGGSGISRFSGVSKKASKLEGPKREKAYLSGDVGGVPAGHGLQGLAEEDTILLLSKKEWKKRNK